MKDIPNYEGLYAITDDGKVWSYRRKKFLNQWLDSGRYPVLRLYKNGIREKKFVHRLVLEAFVSNPENKPYCNHKNGIQLDNRVENLEWCTLSENMQHAWDTGLLDPKKRKGYILDEIRLEVKNAIKTGSSYEVAKRFNVSHHFVQNMWKEAGHKFNKENREWIRDK